MDRLVIREDIRSRLTDSVEIASKLSGGAVVIDVIGGEEMLFSQNWSCPEHGFSIDELTPRMFSFNNPSGACPKCTGLSFFMKVNPDLVIPNKNLSLSEGAVRAVGWTTMDKGTVARMYFDGLAEHYGFSVDTPVKDLPKSAIDRVLYGTDGEKIKMHRSGAYGSGTYIREFEGVINNLERRYLEATSEWARWEIEQVMTEEKCPVCNGARLKKEILAVTVAGINIDEFVNMSVKKELAFLETIKLSARDMMIAEQILKEIKSRLSFLASVGLEYLTLSRASATLSGGESQRIRLATQIGSSLVGVLYILDEPSIGLHQRDNAKLLNTLKKLRDLGNTLIVVEHDAETMLASDYIVDIGPGAGVHGGKVVYQGDVKGLMKCKESITGQYLSGFKTIPVPESRRSGNGKFLTVRGARENNLQNIDVNIPLGEFVCVTGVSGSGKSSLINEILYKYLADILNGAKKVPGKFDGIDGAEYLDKVIDIDQSPIGRTPRSNPATYTGVFTDIRRTQKFADIMREGFRSMSQEEDAKRVRATESLKSKCIFSPIFTCRVKCVRADASTAKRWK